MRWAAQIAVCLLVLLAGCNAPFQSPRTDAADSQTATAEPARSDAPGDSVTPLPGTPRPARVTVVNGDLPVRPGPAFARVRHLLDASTGPPIVEVRDQPTREGGLRPEAGEFESLLGIEAPRPAAESEIRVGGATTPDQTVYVAPGDASASRVERTLAHEFVHVVQFDRDVVSRLPDRLPSGRADTTDGEYVVRSLVEGAATYVSTRYTRRYHPVVETEYETLARIYADASAGTRLFWGAYYHGARYVAASVDDPRDLRSVYADPPATTEQLLHRTQDPPTPLTVTVADADSAWVGDSTDSRGELFVRLLLDSELPHDRAAAAAAGWGNDRLVPFYGEKDRSYAWVIRFDDAPNATDARRAVADYLDAYASDSVSGWTRGAATFALRQIDGRTFALLAGERGFVDGASVSTDDGEVVVEPPESTGE
ncbi:hypothetical protein [Halorientalis pallida]|uniref:DUF4157 domain-containing protein n=1 Tax=Halorientalis pallida TaxID=2479928 RepID=A0A498KWK1_9EURY|nr:hypothetical protein [Halorientalis pallida]RXK49195.1 hypothetical protein EAF64_09750 [Halorientalis pallida]